MFPPVELRRREVVGDEGLLEEGIVGGVPGGGEVVLPELLLWGKDGHICF